jgi:serine/threonine protein phosphatase PrpC
MTEPNVSKPGGLWARLFRVQAEQPDEQPAADTEPVAAAAVVAEPADAPAGPVPVATPVTSEDPVPAEQPAEPADARDLYVGATADDLAAGVADEAPAVPVAEPAAPPRPCPACGTPRKAGLAFCDDCGWLFGPDDDRLAATPAQGAAMATPNLGRLRDRYELRRLTGEKLGTRRYLALDTQTGDDVVVVATPLAAAAPVAEAVPVAEVADEEILPGFDDDVPVAAVLPEVAAGDATWPGAAWEKRVLAKAAHPSLPGVLDVFVEGDVEYLVEQQPAGRSLWDAWDDPDADADARYGWAMQVAQALQALHRAGAMLEGVRPDLVIVNDAGQAMLSDLSDLLPLPVPPGAPLRATLSTAPELVLTPESADARADLYSFGALLYALEYLHHPLEEKDFERQFVPLQITERYPDVHPLFLRLINKTFVRDVNTRFPTDEAGRTDPTGFDELVKTLDVCRRTFDKVRLDIAAWTTTGMVRTGNEDAFALLHGVEARQDDLHEYAVIVLCDGMGGYEAGEVAAALATSEARKYLLRQPQFAALAGQEPPAEPVNVKATQDVLRDALRHANREVYAAARIPGKGRRGMGCTAEAVYVDARNVIVGHVGDSRTYHLHRGRLVQLTRDQTLVNRLVELGQLTADEAENHPRKNELQQAIGGQPDVVPGLSAGKLQRGDWVLVCSDGLSNHITHQELEKMLTREAAYSAEEAARRLLNLVNLRGATDNATIVVVRAS